MKLTPHEKKILSLIENDPDIINDTKKRAKIAKDNGLSEKTLRNRIGDLKKYGVISIDKTKNQSADKKIVLNEGIKENIIEGEEVSVVVEQVNAMPGQGVTSMFNFGQTFGAIKGICAALELPIFFVRPSKWKKHFELINSSKDASRTKAIEMYPKLSKELAKKKDVNKSDAILIARFYSETRLSEDN